MLSLLTSVADFNSRPCGRGFCHSSMASLRQSDFNSRPCGRGFKYPPAHSCHVSRFQFSPLREGLHISACSFPLAGQFQFSPLREGLPNKYSISAMATCISILAPAGGASDALCLKEIKYIDFNSRPCGRGFPFLIGLIYCIVISILAPAGGASLSVSSVFAK